MLYNLQGNRLFFARHPTPTPITMKACTKCDSTENGFFKDSRLKSGVKSVCKKCDQSYKRSKEALLKGRLSQKGKVTKNKKINDAKYRASLKGRISAKNQKYKRRSITGQSKIKHYEWSLILNAFDGKCAYCQKNGEITVDHITPLAKGGMNTFDNILPSCRTCNSSKQAKLFEVFCNNETQTRIMNTLQKLRNN